MELSTRPMGGWVLNVSMRWNWTRELLTITDFDHVNVTVGPCQCDSDHNGSLECDSELNPQRIERIERTDTRTLTVCSDSDYHS